MVTRYSDTVALVDAFDPRKYGATRNFKKGAVSRLSPYISRGIISTRFVYDNLLQRFGDVRPFEKFVQELAWRDYWQRVWQQKNIDEDIKQPQESISHFDLPMAIVKGQTGIHAVDDAIWELYETGYMHNHMRMYVAAIVCNVGQYYWQEGARWMYAHLNDCDWGSNALSWQWVAGTNSSKKYYANQENINKYFESEQRGTFLDTSYEVLMNANVPLILTAETELQLETELVSEEVQLNTSLPTLVYTHYNLDPLWHQDLDANRVLILEPEHFEAYPISDKVLRFILDSAQNIPDIQIFVGSFQDLKKKCGVTIYYKEHPFFRHFEGVEESRDWLHPDVTVQSSFFRYWKSLRKQLPEFG